MTTYQFPLTNDLLTYMTLFGKKADDVMRRQFGMRLNDYRVLAYVSQDMAATASDLAAALGVSKCKVSGLISRLVGKGYLQRGQRHATTQIKLTREGLVLFEEARAAIGDAFEEVLQALSPKQRASFDLGCTATATTFDGFRLYEETPDFVYIYLRSFLLTEQFITKTTRKHGLNLTEFRVMFAALQEGKLEVTEIIHQLLVPKSTLSECIRGLEQRELIELKSIDGRSKMLELTQSGRSVTLRASLEVDHCFLVDVRTSMPNERQLYAQVSEKIVNRERTLRKSRPRA